MHRSSPYVACLLAALAAAPSPAAATAFHTLSAPDARREALYVATNVQSGGGSVDEYAAASSGTPAPFRSITQLGDIGGMAVDASGNVFTVVLQHGPLNVYAPHARGPARPARSIVDPAGIYDPSAVAVDAAGDEYVLSVGGLFGAGTFVAEWPGGANGIVQSTATFAQGRPDLGIATDGADDLLVYTPSWDPSSPATIVTLAQPGGTIVRSISGPHTGLDGLAGAVPFALAPGGASIYAIESSGDSVVQFKTDASGDAHPVRRIAGEKTMLGEAMALAVDLTGNIYVIERFGRIVSFGPGAHGNVAPQNAFTIAFAGGLVGFGVGPR